MIDTIDRESTMKRLEKIRETYMEEKKCAAASAVDACMECVRTEKRSYNTVTLEARRICRVEPFFQGGVIGRDVYRCENCKNVVGKHSVFCETCGRKLTDNP